jgi:ferritin-like metal-binding protein YciE
VLERTTIHDSRELFVHRLGAAFAMETTVGELLGELLESADDTTLARRLRHHCEETHAHIRTLEHAFQTLGKEAETQPCTALDGIVRADRALLRSTEVALHDAAILAACAEIEHYEIAVYENLVATAEAMGQDDVASLLAVNLEQERRMLDEALRATLDLARSPVAPVR